MSDTPEEIKGRLDRIGPALLKIANHQGTTWQALLEKEHSAELFDFAEWAHNYLLHLSLKQSPVLSEGISRLLNDSRQKLVAASQQAFMAEPPALPLLQETPAAAPLADAELAELVRLEQAADKLPWAASETGLITMGGEWMGKFHHHHSSYLPDGSRISLRPTENAALAVAMRNALPGLLARLAKAETAALPLQYKQERPEPWIACDGKADYQCECEWTFVLMPNGKVENAVFTESEDGFSWAQWDESSLVEMPIQPTHFYRIPKGSLAAATPVATVGSEPAGYKGHTEFYMVEGGLVKSYHYVAQCKAENYHILKEQGSELPRRVRYDELHKACTTEQAAWAMLALALEKDMQYIKNTILPQFEPTPPTNEAR